MDEWGRGSKLDLDNPYLDEYKGSSLWNPARTDTTIRSRSRGWYTNFFGERVYSGSNIAGIDLEKLGDKFSPQPPSHALQTAAKWMASIRMKEAIQNTIRTFPFGRFFVVDNK
jgi:hypothetical protein